MPSRTLTEPEYNAIREKVLQAAPQGLDEAGFSRYIGPAMAQALGEAENLPVQPEGSAIGRFVGNAAEMVNPISMVKGVVQAATHPFNTIGAMAGAQLEEFKKAKQAYTEGRTTEAIGHGAAGLLPVVGPLAAQAGEQIASGDVAGGLGKAAGIVAPFGVDAALAARRAGQASRAPLLEREATQQVAGRVLAPGNPAFRGRAQAIAPEVLKRKLTGGRLELQQAAAEGMADAGAKLDEAIEAAGGVDVSVPSGSVIRRLEERLKDLMVKGEPVEGNAGRVAALKDRIAQLRRVGAEERPPYIKPDPRREAQIPFVDLRKMRDESYRVADEARAYEKQGNPIKSDEGWAAREEGSAIRQALAERSPSSAAANADFTFWKTLNDVLDPAIGRPKASAPPAGVTGGARTTGAVIGNMMGPKAAFVMSVVIPWLKDRAADPRWLLHDASAKMDLAKAIRQGNVGKAQTIMMNWAKYGPKSGEE